MARKSTNKAETKPAAVKTAPAAPAAKEEIKAKTETAPAVKEAPVKEEVKAAVKETAAEKKPAAKKPAAAKKTADKPAKKTAAKSAASAKPAAKSTAKTAKAPAKATKTAAKAKPEAAPKKGGRKPKAVTIEEVCAKIAKKASKAKAAKITGTVAVDIEIYGWENGENKNMYIEVKDGVLNVQPYNYEEFKVRVAVPFAEAMAFIEGKLTLKNAIISGKMYAEGVIGDALKLASLFE